MDRILIIGGLGVIAILLGYSWYELFTSRWEREERRIDRFRVVLWGAATLDFLYLFFPTQLRRGDYEKAFVILGAAIPLAVGGFAALRKGPGRVAMPGACLGMVIYWCFAYYFAFIFEPDFP